MGSGGLGSHVDASLRENWTSLVRSASSFITDSGLRRECEGVERAGATCVEGDGFSHLKMCPKDFQARVLARAADPEWTACDVGHVAKCVAAQPNGRNERET